MEITSITFVTILAAIGLLALIVSVITEVTKGVAMLSKIPMNLQVIVLSLTLTMVAYFAYISYSGHSIIWYYVIATIIAGFFVAYMTLYGWDKFIVLYKKFRNIPLSDINNTTSSDTVSAKSTTSIDNSNDPVIDITKIDVLVTATTSTSETLTTDSSMTDGPITDALSVDSSPADASATVASASEP